MLKIKSGEYWSFDILFCSRLKVTLSIKVANANMNCIVGEINEVILNPDFVIF